MYSQSSISFVQPSLFNGVPGLVAAQSTRHGGVSPGEIGTLNLGKYTPDHPARVLENQKRFTASLGFDPSRVASCKQVHGSSIRQVTNPGHELGFDAMITDRKGILLAVTVADCAPILIVDRKRIILAAIHAGWRGTVAGIAGLALRKMKETFQTEPDDCLAWIGACIGPEDYEVDADVADQFPSKFKQWDSGRAKFLLDLKAANQAQLWKEGIPRDQVEFSDLSTCSSPDDFFSHRASGGKAGRGWAVIGLSN